MHLMRCCRPSRRYTWTDIIELAKTRSSETSCMVINIRQILGITKYEHRIRYVQKLLSHCPLYDFQWNWRLKIKLYGDLIVSAGISVQWIRFLYVCLLQDSLRHKSVTVRGMRLLSDTKKSEMWKMSLNGIIIIT